MSRIGFGKTGNVFHGLPPRKDVDYAPDLFMISGSGNCGVVITNEGLVIFDVPSRTTAGVDILELIRRKTQAPIHTIIYSHGHFDHAGRALPFIQEAAKRGYPRPRIISHENVPKRIARYKMLAKYNFYINGIQFLRRGDVPPPDDFMEIWAQRVDPDVTYTDAMQFKLGGLTFELYHGKGETDDGTWMWIPERETAMIGDLGVGMCPNPGSPFKVQRYAKEWEESMMRIAGKNPAFLVPGHGTAFIGHKEVQEFCLSVAGYLRSMHDQVVYLMNEGNLLEDILEKVKVPPEVNEKWWLFPYYGSPEFTIRDIYRRYSGWYDGTPSHLLPAKNADVAAEIIGLGGGDSLLKRVKQLKDEGKPQLALHLIEFASLAINDPGKRKEALKLHAEVLDARAEIETNFIAKNIFLAAAERMEQEANKL